MASSSQTLNYDALLTTTMSAYRKTLEDNIFKANPLIYWLGQQGRKEHQDGGHQLLVPLLYGKNTTVKSYANYDVIDTTPQDGITNAIYPWRQIAGSISISRMEERKNSGAAKIIDLLNAKMMQAEKSMIEEINRMLFLDGTGNGGLDFYGLALLVEEGTAYSTVGGIDSSSDTWWQNYWKSTGAFDDNGRADMRIAYNTTARGNEHCDIIITTQAVYEFYEALLVAGERFADKKIGDAGFETLKFKGAWMFYDDYCTSGYMYFLNSNYLEWRVDKQTDLITTPFVRPSNQDARVAQILLYGNLVCSNRARQGVLTAITET